MNTLSLDNFKIGGANVPRLFGHLLLPLCLLIETPSRFFPFRNFS
jgi:hypothetical protein